MSARESIENLWDRATPVAPLLDAYRAEVLREAAAVVRAYDGPSMTMAFRLMAPVELIANLIDPDTP